LSKTFTINRYPDAIDRYLGKNVADVAWGKRVRDPAAMGLITLHDVLQSIDTFLEERDI
jgi:heptosyltransferase I